LGLYNGASEDKLAEITTCFSTNSASESAEVAGNFCTRSLFPIPFHSTGILHTRWTIKIAMDEELEGYSPFIFFRPDIHTARVSFSKTQDIFLPL
jgi:hypothetical protein